MIKLVFSCLFSLCFMNYGIASHNNTGDNVNSNSIKNFTSKIKIIGNKRIEHDSIIEQIESLGTCEDFAPYYIDLVIKKLFSTGFFASVDVYKQGDNLIVKVVENPIVSEY